VPKDKALKHLESYGFSAYALPKAIGGFWGCREIFKWQELRTRYEWDLPPANGATKMMMRMFDFSHIAKYEHLTEEEQIERRRRMNVVHARRRREQSRLETEAMHESYLSLQEINDNLQKENKRLEDLMEQAKTMIACIEHDPLSSGCTRPSMDTVPDNIRPSHLNQIPIVMIYVVPLPYSQIQQEALVAHTQPIKQDIKSDNVMLCNSNPLISQAFSNAFSVPKACNGVHAHLFQDGGWMKQTITASQRYANEQATTIGLRQAMIGQPVGNQFAGQSSTLDLSLSALVRADWDALRYQQHQ